MVKRLFDILVSAIVLLLLSPLLIAVFLVLRFTGEGEVFFLQERMGYRNEPFRITKLATMLKSAAKMGAGDYTVENDPRVLPVGRFLRKSKINELPQLWDVLRGKMSLVGPRPQVLRINALYPDFYKSVLDRVRPGITGLGSIVFRNEEAILTRAKDRDYCYTQQIVPYKAEVERWYAENQSFWLDIQIMFLTVWHVLVPGSQLVNRLLPAELVRSADSFDGVADRAGQSAAGQGA